MDINEIKGAYLNALSGRERTREAVRLRDNYTCQGCGEIRTPRMATEQGKRKFDVHHINGECGKKSRAYDKMSEMGGLITLCHRCHYNRHDRSPKITFYYGRPIDPDRAKKILTARRDGKTYQEIGKDFGISKQRVRQILEKITETDTVVLIEKLKAGC